MYEKFLNNNYKGVKGITILKSKKIRNNIKNIGIFAITHGNEPVGLEVFVKISSIINQNLENLSGNLFLIAVNIEAYNYFLQQNKPEVGRFLDYNMNRIVGKDVNPDFSEKKRFLELKTIIENLDLAIDLHSIPFGGEIIGICDNKFTKDAKDFMDVEYLLSDNAQNSGALIGLLTKQGKPAFGIECGNHNNKFSYQIGLQNVLNFLSYYKIFETENIIKKTSKKGFFKGSFKFINEIIPKTNNFRFLSNFSNFSKIFPNEVYAIDGDVEYKNTFKYDIYIGILHFDIKVGQGCGFLFEKIV